MIMQTKIENCRRRYVGIKYNENAIYNKWNNAWRLVVLERCIWTCMVCMEKYQAKFVKFPSTLQTVEGFCLYGSDPVNDHKRNVGSPLMYRVPHRSVPTPSHGQDPAVLWCHCMRAVGSNVRAQLNVFSLHTCEDASYILNDNYFCCFFFLLLIFFLQLNSFNLSFQFHCLFK